MCKLPRLDGVVWEMPVNDRVILSLVGRFT
jgi:hypothetical protein